MLKTQYFQEPFSENIPNQQNRNKYNSDFHFHFKFLKNIDPFTNLNHIEIYEVYWSDHKVTLIHIIWQKQIPLEFGIVSNTVMCCLTCTHSEKYTVRRFVVMETSRRALTQTQMLQPTAHLHSRHITVINVVHHCLKLRYVAHDYIRMLLVSMM